MRIGYIYDLVACRITASSRAICSREGLLERVLCRPEIADASQTVCDLGDQASRDPHRAVACARRMSPEPASALAVFVAGCRAKWGLALGFEVRAISASSSSRGKLVVSAAQSRKTAGTLEGALSP